MSRLSVGGRGFSIGKYFQAVVSNTMMNGPWEEFLWRGALQTRLVMLLGAPWGVVLSSLLLGIWHLNAQLQYSDGNLTLAVARTIIMQAVLGLAFGVIYWRTPSKKEFEAARDDLLKKVPELSDTAIIVRLAAVLALLNDAHTNLQIDGPLFPALPLHVGRISDVYVLFGVPTEHKDLLGGKIVQVGGVPMDEAVKRIGTVVSHESEIYVRRNVPQYLPVPAVTEDGIRTVEFEFAAEGKPMMARIERQTEPLSATHAKKYWYQQSPTTTLCTSRTTNALRTRITRSKTSRPRCSRNLRTPTDIFRRWVPFSRRTNRISKL